VTKVTKAILRTLYSTLGAHLEELSLLREHEGFDLVELFFKEADSSTDIIAPLTETLEILTVLELF
jgi:hypothetical protein